MSYPLEILPHSSFVTPFPLNNLKSAFGDYQVCYRVEGSLDENTEAGSFNGRRKLLKKCFPHMPHLSMNLCGGLFLPSYVRYVQKRPGSDDWDGVSSIDVDDFVGCVLELDNAIPVFYKSKVVCQPHVSRRVTFHNKESYKSMKALFPRVDFQEYHDGIEVELVSRIDIKHVPTNLNYWHVQMEAYPQTSDKAFTNDGVDWRRLIFENIRDSILRLYYEETPSLEYVIPEEMYKK